MLFPIKMPNLTVSNKSYKRQNEFIQKRIGTQKIIRYLGVINRYYCKVITHTFQIITICEIILLSY